jgi:hypothetical protein
MSFGSVIEAILFWLALGVVIGFLLGGLFPVAAARTWAFFYRLYRGAPAAERWLADKAAQIKALVPSSPNPPAPKS